MNLHPDRLDKQFIIFFAIFYLVLKSRKSLYRFTTSKIKPLQKKLIKWIIFPYVWKILVWPQSKSRKKEPPELKLRLFRPKNLTKLLTYTTWNKFQACFFSKCFGNVALNIVQCADRKLGKKYSLNLSLYIIKSKKKKCYHWLGFCPKVKTKC